MIERDRGESPKPRIEIQSSSDSVMLRQMLPSEAKSLIHLANISKKHLRKFLIMKNYVTPEKILSRVSNDDSNKYTFGIWNLEILVGEISLSIDEGVGALTWWVGKPFIGNRYASRAGKLLKDFAFEQLGLLELTCVITPENLASRRSAELMGMTMTTNRQRFKRYSILNPNLPPIR